MKFNELVFLAAAFAVAAPAQEPQPVPAPPVAPVAPKVPKPPTVHLRGALSGDRTYDRGSKALDEGHWDEARQIFTMIVDAKGNRADGALYWKAYAENRLGRREDALATLATLRRQYPSSEWLNDAQALTVEIQQQAGKPVDPNAEANEELKLMAINGIMESDPERALPLLENILKSSSSIRLKDRALFVLTQSRSPQAQQLLLNVAKGGSNPDLQLRALRYLAITGRKNAGADIASIYKASHDQVIKKEALNSLLVARASDEIYNIARTEQDPKLRAEAIQELGVLHQNDRLAQLYKDGIGKDVVLENMFLLRDPGKLLEILHTERDAKLRASAIRSLGLIRSEQAGDGLIALYSTAQDPAEKKEIVESLFIQHNVKGLVALARKESNPEMKRDMVEKLTMMHSKESADYLLEILK